MDLPLTLATDPLVTVRPMRRDELGIAIGLVGDEGWNPGLHDAEPFWAAYPGGFFALPHPRDRRRLRDAGPVRLRRLRLRLPERPARGDRRRRVARRGLPLETVAEYDRPFSPGPREAFLNAFLTHGYAVTNAAGDLAGDRLVRACRSLPTRRPWPNGSCVPFSAAVPGEPIRLDVASRTAPRSRWPYATACARSSGPRMYSRSVPVLPPGRV